VLSRAACILRRWPVACQLLGPMQWCRLACPGSPRKWLTKANQVDISQHTRALRYVGSAFTGLGDAGQERPCGLSRVRIVPVGRQGGVSPQPYVLLAGGRLVLAVALFGHPRREHVMNDPYPPARGKPRPGRWRPYAAGGAWNEPGGQVPYSEYPAEPPPSAVYGWQIPMPPQPPRSIQAAVMLMYVGAGLEALGLMFDLIIGSRAYHNGSGVVGSAVGVVLWLWMASANRAGKKWARITSTVFFGIDCLFMLLLLAVLRPLLHLAADLGASVPTMVMVAVLAGLCSWVLNLVTIVLLWRKESSDYYAAKSLR